MSHPSRIFAPGNIGDCAFVPRLKIKFGAYLRKSVHPIVYTYQIHFSPFRCGKVSAKSHAFITICTVHLITCCTNCKMFCDLIGLDKAICIFVCGHQASPPLSMQCEIQKETNRFQLYTKHHVTIYITIPR